MVKPNTELYVTHLFVVPESIATGFSKQPVFPSKVWNLRRCLLFDNLSMDFFGIGTQIMSTSLAALSSPFTP
jgi:hypothetical protein